MKLTTVECFDFKSVRTSNPFNIGDVTCLVGKNESGKTTILEALYRLNPIVPEDGNFDITDDYPRIDVADYEAAIRKGKQSHAVAVRATFTLEDEEITELAKTFGNVLPNAQLRLAKGYDTRLDYDCDPDETAAAASFVDKAQLPAEISNEAKSSQTLAALLNYLTTKADEQSDAVQAAKAKANALENAEEKAKALDDANRLAESQAAQQLRTRLTEIQTIGIKQHLWESFLSRRVPKFLYFDEYYQMHGGVNIDALQKRKNEAKLEPSDRPMLALIELAGLELNQLQNATSTQDLNNKLEGASNRLSRSFLKYWSTNKHLRLRFDVRHALPGDPPDMRTGINVWASVHDLIHHVTTLFGVRSRGFVWFFSFVAYFSQQKNQDAPLILLLDEPGLFLHGSAQGDLLRYIEEELKSVYQVIYTTHSPFMVDATHFDRIRIVEDKSVSSESELPPDEQGTKVLCDVLEAAEGSLFPLQGALGYDLSQTLFVGPNCLIVEGVSDLIYIQTITAILERQKKSGLSPKWTVTPVGGAGKVPTFVALLGSQKNLNLATLIDFQTSDQQQIENLYKKRLLQKKRVITFADFTNTSEADIEDMFDVSFYLHLVNLEFGLTASPIQASAFASEAPRILQRLELHFTQHPLPKAATFNHYRPARYFAENVAALEGQLSAGTLKRFEDAFERLNELL
jgi:predicted ATP-dependent endonuclease of OLD family